MPKSDYVHQHLSDSEEYNRLRRIETMLDPRSQGFLEKLGLKEGASVLEAGAGGGGLLSWLSKKVGPTSKVVAVDMDTRYIKDLALPNVEVLEADLTQMDFGQEKFDFIHERYVFTHIPDVQSILKKMMAALKPGGWILLEDADSSNWRFDTADPAQLKSFRAIQESRKALFESKGLDYAFGSRLPGILRQSGFTQVGEETFSPLDKGGEGKAEIMRLSVLGLWDQYLKLGVATEADLKFFVTTAADPQQTAVYYSSVSAWGQKPR